MGARHQSTAGGRRHRRLGNYLLDRTFQLKYVAMILGLSALISFGLGVFLVDQMRENSRLLQLDAELDPVFQEQLAQADTQAVLVLVGALILFNLLLALGALIVTHRMAGPIFVFRRYLRMLSDGRIPQIRDLRRGDEFGDVLEELRRAVTAIERGFEDDLELSGQIRNALKSGAPDEVAAVSRALDEFDDKRRQALGLESSS